MRWFGTVILIFLSFCGCSSTQQSSVEQVRNWLGEFPDFGEQDFEGIIWKRPYPIAEFTSKWLEKGKKIPDIETGLVEVLTSESVPYRAVFAAGHLESDLCVPHLLILLDSEDALMRIEVAKALGMIGNASAIQKLGQRVIADSNANVKLNAIVAIEKIDHPSGVEFLLCAEKDDNQSVAEFATRALSRMND